MRPTNAASTQPTNMDHIIHLKLSDEQIPACHPYDNIDVFNRVQSTILVNGLPTSDANLVLGTATSSGKTISAELFIHATDGKVVYSAPMKALVNEKYREWSERFGQDRVAILTGDQRGASGPKIPREKLEEARIVVVTSEMLDHQSRVAIRDPDHWLHKTRLLIIDEAHIIGNDSRGAAAELGITRLGSTVRPRIVLLSATLPNVNDFARWVHGLNGKPTYTLNSPWRPVPLTWHIIPVRGSYYSARRNVMYDRAVKLIKRFEQDKFLIFVHEKKTGFALKKKLKSKGVMAEFHRADLGLKDRTDIESSFLEKDGDLRVLIATSTLAYGNNLPARRVIIMGTIRGQQPVDAADIIQMSGRAGRFGMDPEGDCYLLVDSVDEIDWDSLVNNSPEVFSTLTTQRNFRFQLLAEINLGTVKGMDDVMSWYASTLAGHQTEFDEDLIRQIVVQLEMMRMLDDNKGTFSVTKLGQMSNKYYMYPEDLHYWDEFIRTLKSNKLCDEIVSLLIGGAPTIRMEYIPAGHKPKVDKFVHKCDQIDGIYIRDEKKAFKPYVIYEHLSGNATDNPELSFHIRMITADIERLWSAICDIAALNDKKDLFTPEWLLRLQKGIPQQLAFLCSIPGIGPKRAWLLYVAGVTDPEVLKGTDRAVLVNCVGAKLADRIIEYRDKL